MAKMEIETGDGILRKVAAGGSMDYPSWPDLLPTVLASIEKIAHTEFPIPNIPTRQPPAPARPPSPRFLAPLPSSDPVDAPESSQETNKQDAEPSSPSGARNNGARASTAPASTAPEPSSAPDRPTLPKPVADMLDEILSVLRTNFSQYPPHTIQRLAELVLSPRQHYRHLVPYLHALDRVVHVSSGANVYPLPPALPDISAMTLLSNGVGSANAGGLSINTSAANNIGSDEALGGALLTPIPWLTRRANGGASDDGSDIGSSSPLSAGGEATQQFPLQQQQRQGGQLEGRVRTESTETIEGPNGMGSIETVSVSVNGIPSMGAGGALLSQRSVTQGELLRQEQRAGVVPLSQLNRQQQQQQIQTQTQPQTEAQGNTDGAPDEDAPMTEPADEEEEEEVPHARGPDEIGPADTGRDANYMASGSSLETRGIDVEAAVGRRGQQDEKNQTPPRASGSSPETAAELVPRSPKREATDDLQQGPDRKRIKEGEPATTTNTTTTSANQDQEKPDQSAEPQFPKRDAEGDVILPDRPAAAVPAEAKPQSKDASAEAEKSPAATETGSAPSTEGVDKKEEDGGTALPAEEETPLSSDTLAADSDAGNQSAA